MKKIKRFWILVVWVWLVGMVFHLVIVLLLLLCLGVFVLLLIIVHIVVALVVQLMSKGAPFSNSSITILLARASELLVGCCWMMETFV